MKSNLVADYQSKLEIAINEREEIRLSLTDENREYDELSENCIYSIFF